MTEHTPGDQQEGAGGLGRGALIFTVIAVLTLAVSGALIPVVGGEATPLRIVFLVAQVAVISIVVWQACDPFADAAQWLGKTLRIPGSVRGATLDAVASSMPELFSGVFFVVVAMTGVGGDVTVEAASGEGYGSTVATCAGSAVYNMILIPAFCALFISVHRKQRPTIDVEPEVLSRDGLWFLGCSLLLIFFLFQPQMHWWMAVVLLLTYGVYVGQLYYDARAYRRAHDAIHKHLGEVGPNSPTEEIVATLRSEGVRATPRLVDELRRKAFRDEDDEEEEEEDDSAGAFFGFVEIPLSGVTTTLILMVATAIAAVACYWLVEVTNTTAHVLNIPPFFVAVIVAAAASSVPDTFLSVMAARRGDDSGAVSNAFGSNIFDICICLSIPLLINCGLNGWRPIALASDGHPMAGLVDLRILLCLLTVVTLLIMWHNLQLTRRKALVLCALYGVFIAYAVLGSMGVSVSAMLGFA